MDQTRSLESFLAHVQQRDRIKASLPEPFVKS